MKIYKIKRSKCLNYLGDLRHITYSIARNYESPDRCNCYICFMLRHIDWRELKNEWEASFIRDLKEKRLYYQYTEKQENCIKKIFDRQKGSNLI